MLQQTTVAAVRPYYEKFMQRFPSLKSLAQAKIEDVYIYWAGLGYYSRARNLHRSAQMLWNEVKNGKGFPQTATQLLEYPGFGPYTSRAVASLAFDEPVGVLDGNVIRILTRHFGLDIDWWVPKAKNELQSLSDSLVQSDPKASSSSDVNQGMMELGATICTPKNPLCLSCPWKKTCKSFADGKVSVRPKPKPRPEKEIWEWNFFIERKDEKIYVEENAATPFLKGTAFPKSEAKKISKKPKKFSFSHSVTKYAIFVTVNESLKARPKQGINRKRAAPVSGGGRWIDAERVAEFNPTSLMKKILSYT